MRTSRLAALLVAPLLVAVALATGTPAFAQSTGMVKGKVVDGQDKPVDGAKVVIEFQEGVNRKFEVKTNKKGEYIQIGLQPGRYKITASKDGVGTGSQETKVGIGSAEQIDLKLGAGGGGELSKEEQAFRKAFGEGIEASKKADHDAAIAKFTEALALRPDCYACQYNIGGAHLQKQEFDKAEAALLAAAKLDTASAEPYNALANMYNSQKKFDKAAEATAEAMKRGGAAGAAGGGASPDVLFNQGVTLWNAGKPAEAKAQFEAAAKAKPDYADAHYWIGMANLNEGKMPEATAAFEKYLEIAPTGQHAAQVKTVLSQIKP